MSDTSAIHVSHLSKRYRLGQIGRHTLHDEAAYWWHRMNRRDPFRNMARIDQVESQARLAQQHGDVFWALRDVSFDIRPGEAVGVVGANGAGKSTLLKILCRITGPTAGEVLLRGRIGSLLEVGTGFHQDLTGRENVYMNGAILGMRKAEIDRKFDEIVAFAEIGEFLDTPVKRYSSGMRVRLAFAVAAHLDAEILMIDEVLAVGDARFQRKCLGAMETIGGGGRTILFVSHNLVAVRRLCSRCLWISDGQLVMDDTPANVVSRYLAETVIATDEARWDGGLCSSAAGELRVLAVRVRSAEGRISSNQRADQPFDIEIEYCVRQPLAGMRIGFVLTTAEGTSVFSSFSSDSDPAARPCRAGSFRSRCRVPAGLLAPGSYVVSLRGGVPNVQPVVSQDAVLSVVVADTAPEDSPARANNRPGIVRPILQWTSGEQSA